MKWIKIGDSIINMNRFYDIKIIKGWDETYRLVIYLEPYANDPIYILYANEDIEKCRKKQYYLESFLEDNNETILYWNIK